MGKVAEGPEEGLVLYLRAERLFVRFWHAGGSAFPYICLIVRRRAIILLREDSVSRLVGSLASSA
jgi:hypothetical protein